MKHALNHQRDILARLGRRRRLLIMDFDGTLAAIARHPGAAGLDPRTLRLLRRIAADPSFRTAIISGRQLKDLLRRVPSKGLCLFGNHGLELSGNGLRLPERARRAERFEGTMRRLKESLASAVAGEPGAFVENKGLTLSVHFRLVSAAGRPRFLARLARRRRTYRDWPVVWKKGKKVWEARPKVRWDKGDAAALFSRRSGGVPIVIGDDVSDEDMFSRMRKTGITIRVGPPKASRAEYSLRSPAEVRRFLESLTHES